MKGYSIKRQGIWPIHIVGLNLTVNQFRSKIFPSAFYFDFDRQIRSDGKVIFFRFIIEKLSSTYRPIIRQPIVNGENKLFIFSFKKKNRTQHNKRSIWTILSNQLNCRTFSVQNEIMNNKQNQKTKSILCIIPCYELGL